MDVPLADSSTVAVASMSLPFRIALVVSASVTEEIQHRAWLWNSAFEATGSRTLASAIDGAVFAAQHISFFGARTVAARLPAMLAPTIFFARRRKLPAVMWLHLALDASLLAPRTAGYLPAPQAAR
jgi:membrane protease YdiL (CAAX protease family)